jgi:uncharacterized damage-inducible protein DinB
MKEQLLLAWNIHQQHNLLLLSHLTDADLQLSLSSRSRTVGEQLAHLHHTRLTWLEAVAKPIYNKSLVLPKEAVLTTGSLKQALEQSAACIRQLIDNSWENGGKLASFKTGLIPFVSYLISHESHHRGNMVLTLKQHGYKLPDALKWGLWEWNKP